MWYRAFRVMRFAYCHLYTPLFLIKPVDKTQSLFTGMEKNSQVRWTVDMVVVVRWWLGHKVQPREWLWLPADASLILKVVGKGQHLSPGGNTVLYLHFPKRYFCKQTQSNPWWLKCLTVNTFHKSRLWVCSFIGVLIWGFVCFHNLVYLTGFCSATYVEIRFF